MKYHWIKPLLYLFPPEMAHHLALFYLKHGQWFTPTIVQTPALSQSLWALNFPNPVGLAAGFDKDAEAIYPLLREGFGFIEVGTVTPLPQSGNPKPRLFRLAEDEAIINRMGFNNKGVDAFGSHIQKFPELGIVGANIGKNKQQEDAVADYVMLLEYLYGKSDYITINISSPNTPGLRKLQSRDALHQLLEALVSTRKRLQKSLEIYVPLLLKMAPDVNEEQENDIAEAILTHGIDGLIISNTTIERSPSLKSKFAREAGGLSGKPLMEESTALLKRMYIKTNKQVPLIGVGGIASAQDAYKKIRSGASLVQLYSALIYQGFGLVREINTQLPQLLAADGFDNISQAIGADCI